MLLWCVFAHYACLCDFVPLLCFEIAYMWSSSMIKSWRISIEKVGESSADGPSEQSGNAKPSKEKMSKAERRALQEAQRAAKAAAKGMYYWLSLGPVMFMLFLWNFWCLGGGYVLHLDSILLVIYDHWLWLLIKKIQIASNGICRVQLWHFLSIHNVVST